MSSASDYTTSESQWDSVALYCLIVDKDAPFTGLYGYYHPTPEYYSGSWYFPDDEDTEYPLISLDNPPTEDAAWDAKPI